MTVGPTRAWQRTRFWLALGAALLLAAGLVALLSPQPAASLDPRSPAKGGSKALAQLLRHDHIAVRRTSSVADARRAPHAATLLVVRPDDYSAAQLRALRSAAGRVVLLDPSPNALAAAAPGLSVGDVVGGTRPPDCAAAGPRAAGPVDFGDRAASYDSRSPMVRCYGGAVVFAGPVAVLGSADLLRNDALTRRGVAALDVNLLSADRTVDSVTWLLPGADASGAGAPTVWELFPSGVHRAAIWLVLTGLVVVLWRARRLGPPVAEPLPVVVRAAEVVEGHGRLYRRGGSRAEAAAALRAGTAARLARRRGTPPDARAGRWLSGPVPTTDRELVELARALRTLETDVHDPKGSA
jgi:hypothetical protein